MLIFYHNEFDCFIEVTSYYRVNTENSTKYKNFLEKYKQRPDPNAIYPIKNDEIDKNFIEEAKKAFFQDTDIKFEEMCNRLNYLPNILKTAMKLPAIYFQN
ncbi:hypothetical protein AGMMS5026_09660 [Endomicrobiia bacterium]|nr:hypothetical protein AGMMS49523_04330 [Endomicrobiia bacterium]GHT13901.1 hypothetical protein AGMMS49571_08500 [Endomicrobiia bacterium]GHT19348.1 hypothetical protein AGMMS49929_02860 [Endomicrobiia bacterium]GHT26934.1 hypothetical protein AGMMS49995_04710 [Endomicrobiia bacterium]GHT32127.1 hypothetical protein AGMMS5026_09660 [Endomicrobiia bacterium]